MPLKHPRITAAIAEMGLTRRESMIVDLLARGYNSEPLAAELKITQATLRTHLRNIFASLRINSRAELLAIVLANVIAKLDSQTQSQKPPSAKEPAPK